MGISSHEAEDPRLQETHLAAPEHGDEVANRIESGKTSAIANEVRDTSDRTRTSHNYGTAPGLNGSASPDSSVDKRPARVLAPDLLRGLLMVLQSLDHSALSLGAWQHGTGVLSETDGRVVDSWNEPVAWTVRTLTHLCAPGFMFLLGMGVVYFGRSRSKLGWPLRRMLSHFAIRAIVLALVSEALGLLIGRGRFIVFNIVLLALAFDYFLSGALWLLIDYSESKIAAILASHTKASHGEEESQSTQPLLESRAENDDGDTSSGTNISWHVHNAVLLVLTFITLWWNIWLSPNGGHCVATRADPGKPSNPFFAFWFYSVSYDRVMSGFPPLAWLSFAILGILYGRIVTARQWPTTTINVANAAVGAVLFALFAATRLLHVGNLSEGCLHMPEHQAHPDQNQYLTSFRAFFYIIKYPPSPAYLFFTMSVNFGLLAGFGALPPAWARNIPTLMTFGTSALFFYVTHLVLFGIIGAVVKPLLGHELPWSDMMNSGKHAIGLGDSPAYWLCWAAGLAVLLPLCHWYGRFKSRKGPDSLWRFF